MGMLRILLLLSVAAWAEDLPRGEIVERVTCAADAAQSYALYLPSGYTPSRAWPIILAFDPGGRGRRPVEQYEAAAEKFGYIVVGSNVSRNGSWAVSMGAAQAMAADAASRFRVDDRRVYTAGMSGGARVAMGLALAAPALIAGVVASSAGFPDSQPRKSVPFAVFGTAGAEDFNWMEMRAMDRAFTSPHRLVIFPGGHVWLSSELAVEAVEWLEIQAMKAGRIPKDERRLGLMFETRKDRAEAALTELERVQGLEGLAADFIGMRDVSEIQEKAAALRKSKAFKDQHKRDHEEEMQDQRALSEILALERGLNDPAEHSQSLAGLADKWKRLAAAAETESDSQQRRTARRVSRGLAMGASERTKDPDYLKLLTMYRPARPGGGR